MYHKQCGDTSYAAFVVKMQVCYDLTAIYFKSCDLYLYINNNV